MGRLLNDLFSKAECPAPFSEHLISQMQFAALKNFLTQKYGETFDHEQPSK